MNDAHLNSANWTSKNSHDLKILKVEDPTEIGRSVHELDSIPSSIVNVTRIVTSWKQRLGLRQDA